MEVDTSTQLTSLQSQIRLVSDLYDHLQSLRQIPSLLLQFPSPSSPVAHQFKQLKGFGDALYSDDVQTALHSAQASEMADKSDLNSNGRAQNRKRRRPPSPESPKPYQPSPSPTSLLFPEAEGDPLRLDSLPDYMRDFNITHQSKLHIWTRARSSAQLSQPVIVRFTVPDVVTMFITLGHGPDLSTLVIETVTAFGPRETKLPHSQSEYTVYQDLSQQVAKMLQLYPHVSFQALMSLLISYEGVFVDRCTICQRVLSIEGHVPSVARVWTNASKEGERGLAGHWSPRHTSCLQ